MNVDSFMYGMEPLGLLIFWGDVVAMRSGLAKVVDVHSQVLARVRRGDATADTCAPRPLCEFVRCAVGPDG